MAEITIQVPYRQIHEKLRQESNKYVKFIMFRRKYECVLAAGLALEENGFLPDGTTYYAWGDELCFNVDKGTDADLAHYFHEGIMYGPNFFVKKIGEWRSPKGKPKHPNGKMLKQGKWKPAGVRHWTEALTKDKDVRQDLFYHVEEILRKKK